MAIFIPRFLRHLRDVDTTGVADGDALTYDSGSDTWVPAAGGSGDLTDAVILAPASSARNVIQPTAGAVIAAIVKAHAAQSVDLTQWQTSAGVPMVQIALDGAVTIAPSSNVGFPTSLKVIGPGAPADAATLLSLQANNAVELLYVDTGGSFNMRLADPLSRISVIDSTGNVMAVEQGKIGVFYELPVVQQTAASIGDLWAALKLYGWLDAGSVAPTIGGAPTTATYITQTPDGGLSNEQALSALATGILKSTTGTGVVSIAGSTDYVAPSLFDANTILKADSDNTPVALTLGANTFPARASTGDILAKAITDFGLSLVDDANAGAALTTLGISAFIQTLVDDATAAAARATLATHPSRILKAGLYYNCLPDPVADGTFTPTKDQVVYTPFPVAVGFTVDRISLGVSAAGTAGAKVRLGIYNDDGTGQPGTLLLDAGTINGDSATYQEITINQALAGGTLYWTAVCWQVQELTSGTVRGTGVASGGAWWVGKSANNQDVRIANYKQAGVTGAFGSATPSTTGSEVANPNVRVRSA